MPFFGTNNKSKDDNDDAKMQGGCHLNGRKGGTDSLPPFFSHYFPTLSSYSFLVLQLWCIFYFGAKFLHHPSFLLPESWFISTDPFSSPSLYLLLQIEWSSTWIKLSIEYGEDRKHIFREDHFGVIISKHFQTKKVIWPAVLCFLIFLCSRKDVLVGVHEWLPLRENTTMIILSLEVCGGELFWRENKKETIFAFTCIMLCDNTFSSFTCTVHNPYSVRPTDQKVAHYSSFSSISLVFKILMKTFHLGRTQQFSFCWWIEVRMKPRKVGLLAGDRTSLAEVLLAAVCFSSSSGEYWF